ncbi:MAG TPA: c-type cytochrome, partial [Usitatibacter sp.]|nr:c-type cytochrome [Usitatibacter sp.]
MYRMACIAAFICAAISGAAFADDEAARGKTAYEANCAACHTVTPGKHGFGPSLAGVVGRDAGTVEGYKFS